jgi:hypothetical protein
MSSRTACSERAVLFLGGAAEVNAPLERLASPASERFRFATDGDEGATGSEGGVRVPLVVAMAMTGARFAMREDGDDKSDALTVFVKRRLALSCHQRCAAGGGPRPCCTSSTRLRARALDLRRMRRAGDGRVRIADSVVVLLVPSANAKGQGQEIAPGINNEPCSRVIPRCRSLCSGALDGLGIH